jgi:hypothetical protein
MFFFLAIHNPKDCQQRLNHFRPEQQQADSPKPKDPELDQAKKAAEALGLPTGSF